MFEKGSKLNASHVFDFSKIHFVSNTTRIISPTLYFQFSITWVLVMIFSDVSQMLNLNMEACSCICKVLPNAIHAEQVRILTWVNDSVFQTPVQVYGLSGSYASALYSAASKQKSLDSVEKDLKSVKVSVCFWTFWRRTLNMWR